METIVRNTVKQQLHDADGTSYEVREERTPEPLPASDLCELLDQAEARLSGPSEEVRRTIGRKVLHRLSVEHPSFFLDAEDTETFLSEFEETIYPELSRLFPEMEFPEIGVDGSSEGHVELVYRYQESPCRFVEGLIEGLADRYEEDVEIDQPVCVRDGDDHCRFHVRIGSAGSPPER